jgi:hypothetical protein
MLPEPNLKARVRMAQVTSNQTGNYLRLEVTDEASGLRVLEVELSPVEGFNFFTNQLVEVEAWLNQDERIGRQHRARTLLVDTVGIGDDYATRKALVAEAVAKLCAEEGRDWKAMDSERDLMNQHRMKMATGLEVWLHGWDEIPEG